MRGYRKSVQPSEQLCNDGHSWAARTAFMEGQVLHSGNSITIRRAVTIHEANPARPPMHRPRYRLRGTLPLGGFVDGRGVLR